MAWGYGLRVISKTVGCAMSLKGTHQSSPLAVSQNHTGAVELDKEVSQHSCQAYNESNDEGACQRHDCEWRSLRRSGRSDGAMRIRCSGTSSVGAAQYLYLAEVRRGMDSTD